MKKRLLIAAIVLLMGTSVVIFTNTEMRPFKSLQASDVLAVDGVFGRTEPYTLSDAEIENLVEALNEIVIYRVDKSADQYEGSRSEMFVLTYESGKKTSVSASYPHFYIDGKAYFTEKEACVKVYELWCKYVYSKHPPVS